MNDKILDELWKSRHEKDIFFLELIEGFIIKESNYYPNNIFYMKDDKLLIDYDKETKYVWINYPLILTVYITKFSLNYKEVIELMKYMLETHLNLQTTFIDWYTSIYTFKLEAHLKLYGIISNNY